MIKKILNGTIAVWANSLIGIILALILVPIILSSTGQEKYGLIVLVIFLSVRQGILGIFIFGVQSTVTKFVAEYHAKGESSKIGSLLSTAILFYTVVSTSLVFILYSIKEWLFIEIFKIPNYIYLEFLNAVDYVFLSIFFQFYSLIILGYLEGLHQFFRSKTIDTITYILYFISVIISLHYGYGYVEIIKFWALTHIITFIFLLIAFIFNKVIYFPSLIFRKKLLIHWFKFSLSIFSNGVSSLIYNHAPKFLAASFISPAALAIFDIVNKIPSSLKSFLGLGNKVIMPIASEISTEGKGTNGALFKIGLKLNIMAFIPLIFALILLSKNILYVWLGTDYVEYAYLMQILLITPILTLFMSYGFSIFLGEAYKLWLFPLFGWLILIFSIIFWYFKLESGGLYALAVGKVFGLAVMAPCSMLVFMKHFKMNNVIFLIQIITTLVLSIIPFLIMNLIDLYVQHISIFSLIIICIVLYFSYAISIYLLVLDNVERKFFHKIFSRFI